ncbi:MAG: SusD/RagB family nutrient-binding outer membrane lipoprotein [Bacteroidales bacterium]|nr:SusD/RagB family nutrient-binding outer membrane lipoprotein [Bacteroidales bacterium]
MKKVLFILMVSLLAVSCSKQKLAEFNHDPINPTSVPGSMLFSYAEKSLSDQVASVNVNTNDFKLWAQYWTETTYTDESNYNIFTRNVPQNAWSTYYRSVLMNLKLADSIIAQESPVTDEDKAVQKNQRAIIDLVAVYTWDRMVTMWGNIPYSEALNINNSNPKYDDALTIQKDLITRATADLAALNDSYGSFDGSDLIYAGDVSMWKKFANGLLIKMAVQISPVASESSLVASTINSAKVGTLASSADNAMFAYLETSPNTNPLYEDFVLSGRSDFVAANTIVDMMNSLNDPRMSAYFTQVDTSSDANVEKWAYVGGPYGESNAYPAYSHAAPSIVADPTFANPLMTYSEIQFYLAEASARSLITDDAATHYDNAVTASIEFWGGSAADAATYLAQPTVAYDPANWQEMIGTQAWISFYVRGYVGWTEWRRLGYPAMNLPPSPATTNGGFPYRYTYPSNEQTLNGASYTKAASDIGGDKLETKLYWVPSAP